MLNVYEQCPTYETDSFVLRLVDLKDAPALLSCYSNKEHSKKFNADHCTNHFYFSSLEEMTQCIRFWLDEYKKKYYVRFAVIAKDKNAAVGTVEIFGGHDGVLRIDLSPIYDTEDHFTELSRLAIDAFLDDFGIENIQIKTANIPEKRSCLENLGFIPSQTFRTDLGYHEYNEKAGNGR